MTAVTPATPAVVKTVERPINVIAFAGYGFYLSRGMQLGVLNMLQKYKQQGKIDYMKEMVPFEDWDNMAPMVATWRDDTYLLGHSYGVAACMGLIRACGTRGPKFPLAVTFDPSQYVWMSGDLRGSGGNAVPLRLVNAHNFWQSGWPIGYQRLKRDDGSSEGIVNEEVDARHATIDDIVKVQKKAVALIEARAGLNNQSGVLP